MQKGEEVFYGYVDFLPLPKYWDIHQFLPMQMEIAIPLLKACCWIYYFFNIMQYGENKLPI